MEKTPNCCKHIKKILLFQAFQYGALDFIAYDWVPDLPPTAILADKSEVHGHDIPCLTTAPILFQVFPWFPTFVIETAPLCEHHLNSAAQHRGKQRVQKYLEFSEALAVDVPLFSLEIGDKPSL